MITHFSKSKKRGFSWKLDWWEYLNMNMTSPIFHSVETRIPRSSGIWSSLAALLLLHISGVDPIAAPAVRPAFENVRENSPLKHFETACCLGFLCSTKPIYLNKTCQLQWRPHKTHVDSAKLHNLSKPDPSFLRFGNGLQQGLDSLFDLWPVSTVNRSSHTAAFPLGRHES